MAEDTSDLSHIRSGRAASYKETTPSLTRSGGRISWAQMVFV